MAELLVSATNINTQQIGEIVDSKPDGHVWGTREQPPNYVHVTVTGATHAEVQAYLNTWPIRYRHQIQVDNPIRYRIKVDVDPAVVSASGMGRAQLRAAMGDWIEAEYNGTVVATGSERLIFDVPKPVDLFQLALDFADIFDWILSFRRYHFAASDVATWLTAGGHATLTKAQALAAIVDKLEL